MTFRISPATCDVICLSSAAFADRRLIFFGVFLILDVDLDLGLCRGRAFSMSVTRTRALFTFTSTSNGINLSSGMARA
jgi:hypothetical protein